MATFQILLAVGLPFGHAAFGGANAVLSAKLRIASALSALVFCAALYIVLERGLFSGGVECIRTNTNRDLGARGHFRRE